MNVNSEIKKKSYVSPIVAFDEIEEDVELLAGTGTSGSGGTVNPDPDDTGGGTSNDPNFGGAKGTSGVFSADDEYDFVFEIDN